MIEKAKELLEKIYHNPRLGIVLSLGCGCERIAYQLTDDLVVKIDKEAMYNKELLATYIEDMEVHKYSRSLWDYAPEDQSALESHIYETLSEEERKIVNPILGEGSYKGHKFLICPKVKPAREYNVNTLQGLSRKLEKPFDMALLKKFCYKNDLDFGDLVENPGNFGIDANDNIVLIDYGLREIKI